MKMNRFLHIAATSILALGLAGAPAVGQNRGPALPPRPPNNVLERLERMSPEQREKVLSRLPPERRRRIEERLRWYDSLPPEERERLAWRYERFRQLPPERQQEVRQFFRRFGTLPPERRLALRQEARRLRFLPGPARQARINSPAFQNRYSPEERDMLRTILELAPQ